jgi:hypothetical protein
MGAKKPSIRKLPSGEKVVHRPDETITLVPENKVLGFLIATQDEFQAEAVQIQERLLEAIESKQESLDAGDPVPHDKRPI